VSVLTAPWDAQKKIDAKGKDKSDEGDEDEPDEPYYLRAALVQAIRFRSNRKARTAIENGSFLRAFDDPYDVLTDLHKQVEGKREVERCVQPYPIYNLARERLLNLILNEWMRRAKLELARQAKMKNSNYREALELKKLLLTDVAHLHPPPQWRSLKFLPLAMGLFHSAATPYGRYFVGEEW
jgi:hypothetical protein